MGRHVFIDNSNIFGGAQRAASTIEPNVPWTAIRIYYKNLFKLLENGGEPVLTRILGGSVPPGNEMLWQAARDLGYDTNLLNRIEADDGRLIEQAVDEVLHLKIANALLDYDGAQTLVIASGDGQDSNFGTSFYSQVVRALKRGWVVRIWSWHAQMTSRYASLAASYPGLLHINDLDAYYNSITFVKGGGYIHAGNSINVRERIVSPI